MIDVIAAIDILEGKCVRLSQGDFTQKKIYSQFPLDIAKQFEGAGIKRLHLVDLDGAREGKLVNIAELENIATKTTLKIDFGGGIKTTSDIDLVFNAGAAIATIGSIAVKQPGLFYRWIEKYNANKILLGADIKDNTIATNGWRQSTTISVYDFIEQNMKHGVNNIFCTDVAKDGLLQGPSVELYKTITKRFTNINLIASGGVSDISDIIKLNEVGCKGVIIGKAIYEGKITLNDLKPYID
jgi:phosphoribosylformimino-5-aminoimidazole carboxamide ribotide isomerase